MKKTIKVLAIAFVAMTLAVACNGNKNAEDTTAAPVMDTIVDEPAQDTAVIDTVPAEEPAKKATTKPKTNTTKPAQQADASKMNANDNTTGSSRRNTNASSTKSNSGVDASNMNANDANAGNARRRG